jgi:hypothetical protein
VMAAWLGMSCSTLKIPIFVTHIFVQQCEAQSSAALQASLFFELVRAFPSVTSLMQAPEAMVTVYARAWPHMCKHAPQCCQCA